VSALRSAGELTAPAEDYLKAIYELEAASGGTLAAGTNDIAQAVGVGAASASGMLRRLAEQGLLAHEPYRGVRLTAAGRIAALRTIRRHRVIEAYLAKALGYPWDRVHDEAERLEHAASDELVDRMAAAIGEPETDPHGAPIPTRDGTMDERRLSTLADVPVGARARVCRVGDEDGERLRYLAALGITPGTEVEVVSRAPFGGPIALRVASGDPCAIGPELAGDILVESGKGETAERRDG
jgi:DtxR family Mn-dependent transcriptional regulator